MQHESDTNAAKMAVLLSLLLPSTHKLPKTQTNTYIMKMQHYLVNLQTLKRFYIPPFMQNLPALSKRICKIVPWSVIGQILRMQHDRNQNSGKMLEFYVDTYGQKYP